MMLNGLQISSKTPPLDTSSAKHLPMDADTTEPVSFGMLLKLKEKQLQQEQEVSASFVAAAFASLQTSQFVAPLPIQKMETVETATKAEVSQAAMNAIPQAVTTPIDRPDPSFITQAPAFQVNVTEPIQSMFPAVSDSANENTSPFDFAKPEIPDALSPASFGKTTKIPITNSLTADQIVQIEEQVLTLDVAKNDPAMEQAPASVPSPKSDAIFDRDVIKSTEPTAKNQVSTVSNTPSSSSDAIGVNYQESALQTLDAPVASQSTKNQKAETNKTIEFRNASVIVQPEIKENIRSYQTTIKGNETVLEPLPVRISEDVPARDLPMRTGTDNSTIQQIRTNYRGQQSKSSAPEILAPSLFSPNVDESEKMEKPITSQVENEIDTGALRFNNTKDEIVSTPEIEPIDNPVGEPTSKQKIAVATNVDPGSIEAATTNSKVELPNNLNSYHEVEMSSAGNHIQGSEFSTRLDQPGSQDSKTQVEQSSFGKVGTNETKYDQTIQLQAIPAIDDDTLADDQAGFNSISASEHTVEQLSDAQGKIDLHRTSQGSTGPVEVMADPEKGSPGISNTYKPNTATKILSTESGDAPFEAGETTSPIETTISSPLTVSSDQLSTLTENVLPISQSAMGFQAREALNAKVEEKVDSIALDNSWAETETIQESDKPVSVNVFSIRTDVHDITSTKPVRDLNSGEPLNPLPQTDPTLEIEPETDAFNKQVIISRPEQDLSYAATKSEKKIPLVFKTVEKKINLATENSIIQEQNPANLFSDMVMPVRPEFILEKVFNPEAPSNVQSSQSMTRSTETQNSPRQIAVKISLSEQVVAEPSEIPARNIEIDTHKIATELNVDEKIQSTEPNLSNLDGAVRSETLETRVANTTTVVMDLVGVENNTLQSRYVESDNTADLTGHVLSKTASTVGNQDVADGDISKPSTNENISLQTTQDTKSYETVPQVSDESSFQPEVAKAVEAKNGETQLHVDLPMDQSAQNGTTQFRENKSKSDVEVKPEGFKSLSVGADEKINTRTESINDVRPASHQGPRVVEIIKDPIAPVLPNLYSVEGPDVKRKPRQIENDEKTLPVEIQPRVNQTPGIAAPANGPVKDTTTTHLGENVLSNQLRGDVKEVVDHVIRHINSNLKNGQTSMHVQLSPRGLGAIDVQMVSDSQGVHVTFFAEQASTGKLLETQLDQLRASLVDSGVHLSGLDIGQHNQSGQKGGSFEQSPNFTQHFSRNFPDSQTVSQEKPSLKKSLGQSNDIDYLI